MSIETTNNSGGVQRSKDVLVADLKRVVSDADDLMKEVVNTTAEEFSSAHQRIEAKLSEARARIERARLATKQNICDIADSTQVFVKENPWTVIGVASAVGFITSYLLMRRADRS